MAVVSIKWHWIDCKPGFDWKEHIVPQLEDLGISEYDLKSSVYVIRVAGYFVIKYPKGNSPVLYVGEGNFKDRIKKHDEWLKSLNEIVHDFPFQVAFCLPKCKGNNHCKHQDTEAAVLHAFKKKYGLAPFKNKQMEYAKIDHEYAPHNPFNEAFNIGKGIRYGWAIEPLPSNLYYETYHRV